MPELPEVETVRRVLAPQLQGLTITAVTVNQPKVIARPTAAEFCQTLAGQTIAALTRRGKFLGLTLESGDRILLHLRMTGALLLTPAGYPPEKHTHVVFHLNNGAQLRFSDLRRFGRFWLLRAEEADTYSGIDKLGPEPWDTGLTAGYLEARLGKGKRAIKSCLLDQGVVAGIGNIYADEILFAAKIHPERPAGSLTHEEWERLAAAIPERLAFFIAKSTLSPTEYLENEDRIYRSKIFRQVYGHSGEPCPVCGTPLSRTTVGGRSSVFCPHCQKS